MESNNSEIAARIRDAISLLTDIVTAIEGPSRNEKPVFPQAAAEMVKNRICLKCGEEVPKGQVYKRGLDANHYAEVWTRGVKAKKISEFDAIQAGLLAPEGEQYAQREDISDEVRRRLEMLKLPPAIAAQQKNAAPLADELLGEEIPKPKKKGK